MSSEPSGATTASVGAKPCVPVGSRKTSGLGPVGRSLQLQGEKPDFAEGPVEREHAAAIVLGKLVVAIADHPRRRPPADRPEDVHGVEVIISRAQLA